MFMLGLALKRSISEFIDHYSIMLEKYWATLGTSLKKYILCEKNIINFCKTSHLNLITLLSNIPTGNVGNICRYKLEIKY
jgi:hypothetical protein